MTLLSKRTPFINDQPTTTDISTWNGSEYTTNTYAGLPLEWLSANSFSSVNTPGFRNLKKRDLPINNFHAFRVKWTDSFGTVRSSMPNGTIYRGTGRTQMSTSISALSLDVYGPNFPDALNEARINALKSMSNMKFNAAQAFAERRQTANLLVTTANRVVSLAVLIRKGNFEAANRVLRKQERAFLQKKFPKNATRRPTQRDFESLWLEYSYGWRPLLGDIYGSAEYLAQTYTQSRPSKASGKASRNAQWRNEYSTAGLTGRAIMHSNVKAISSVYYDVDNTTSDILRSTGITNPALLAWELIPYSFVVDWFLPVGSYLNALAAPQGLKFVKGFECVLASGGGTASSSSDGTIWHCTRFGAKVNWAEITRTPLNGFPVASFPPVRLDLNLSQFASGYALLKQIFRR